MKTYYQMLDVAPTASVDDIKRAFRREIARYHPDKVQHLGQEFQEIAASKAAELTQAYKTLADDALRAEYDAQLASGAAMPRPGAPQPPAATPPQPEPERQPEARPAREPEPAQTGAVFTKERADASDLVRRASVIRFRRALEGEFGQFEQVPAQGFEVTCVPKQAFWSLKPPPRVIGRFVPHVDGAAVAESWVLAGRIKKDAQRDLCVFVMGPAVAPAGELAEAIAEQRRKPLLAAGRLFMVPVNTTTWAAHVPADAPPVIKSLLARLKSA